MKAYIVIGLGYGDEGKGTITDALCRQFCAKLVVRFNGGGNAAHTVCTPDGKRHIFSQFGSGTLAGAKTLLSRYMLVNPLAMINEAEALRAVGVPDAMDRVYIDERAMITTPFHIALNRLREMSRGVNLHGSCGMGIGETMAYALAHPSESICAKDLRSPDLTKKLAILQQILMGEYSQLLLIRTENAEREMKRLCHPVSDIVMRYVDFAKRVHILSPQQTADLMSDHSLVVFEGAQGVLLDEDFGFAPYTTWSKTTAVNARSILHEFNLPHRPTVIGVTRTYSTRHGAGPFVSENPKLPFVDPNNPFNPWQKGFRVGDLDLVTLKYAIQCQPIDCVALTHMDAISTPNAQVDIVQRYQKDSCNYTYTNLTSRLTEELFKSTPVKERVRCEQIPWWIGDHVGQIGILSFGTTHADKQWKI